MKIYKKTTFAAAHYLPDYDGLCHNLHGHTWTVEIGVEGHVDKNTGMVIDFKILKAFLKEYVEDKFDHKFLNDIMDNPTAENIAEDIKNNFLVYFALQNLLFTSRPCCVRVWESEDSFVEEII
jgi:6-pyruvoyltetrahydropterin/6-carboxytetrahydropterin synthase